MSYRVFNRTWWKVNASWPNGLEPCAGPRHYHRGQRFATIEEAREYCRQWNNCHKPGRLSNKCEFEEA